MSRYDDFQTYKQDCLQAHLSLDKDIIYSFFKKYNEEPPEDDIFWEVVHKYIVMNTKAPARQKQLSGKWLLKNNSYPGIYLSEEYAKEGISNLLPCPFCGHDVEVYNFQLFNSTGIICRHCGALTTFISGAPDFVTAARWNIARVSLRQKLLEYPDTAPCPFCGEEIAGHTKGLGGPYMFDCDECDASVSFFGSESKRASILSWNTRPSRELAS